MKFDSPIRDERGVALLLALVTIGFLSVITVMMAGDVDRQLEDSAALKERLHLDSAIDSGLSLVRAALYTDGKANQFDSYHDSWAGFEPDRLASVIGGDVSLDIKVEDLSGRLQINPLVARSKEARETAKEQEEPPVVGENAGQGDVALHEKMASLWKKFLLSGKFKVESEQQADEILDALRDWLDEDEDTRNYGAESAYYQSLASSYRSRNDEIRNLEELLLVKGITPELLFGDEEHEGIGKYITEVGDDGKININTAPPLLLRILSVELTEEMAEEMTAFREEPDNAEQLAKSDWYRTANILPGDIVLDESLISTRSRGVRFVLTASKDNAVRTAEGILVREDNGEQSLKQWRFQ